MGTKADDEVDDEVDDETDDETDEQPDTTDIPAAQRREHERKGLQILTPQQILSRLPISLAQLKAGNKNEIR